MLLGSPAWQARSSPKGVGRLPLQSLQARQARARLGLAHRRGKGTKWGHSGCPHIMPTSVTSEHWVTERVGAVCCHMGEPSLWIPSASRRVPNSFSHMTSRRLLPPKQAQPEPGATLGSELACLSLVHEDDCRPVACDIEDSDSATQRLRAHPGLLQFPGWTVTETQVCQELRYPALVTALVPADFPSAQHTRRGQVLHGAHAYEHRACPGRRQAWPSALRQGGC